MPRFPVYEQYRSGPTACGADRPDSVTPMTFDAHEDQGLEPTTLVTIVVETSCGDLEIELDPGLAPFAVNSFVFLARQGYFDGTVSHRIIPGFMFQAGDQTATGAGTPGYRIEQDEYPADGFSFSRGVVAMANAGPGTTGSQFFIMLADYALSPDYTVIGTVATGIEVLDAISGIPLSPNASGELSVPLEALYVERVRIVDRG